MYSQYALGNRHDSFEMFDTFLAKSVEYKFKTMYSTDRLTIFRSYIALLTYSDIAAKHFWEQCRSTNSALCC